MLHVPFYAHAAEYLEIQTEIDAAVHRVLVSGHYEQAEEVQAFEREFSSYLGVDHAVTTGSCHDAMHRGMLALGIGPGDEVITVANTDIACVIAIRQTGASPVFVDIDERTYNIDPTLIRERLTPRTKAILVIHMYGHPVDLDPIITLASENDLYVVEDVAIAVGAKYKGRLLGTFGDIGCFSHHTSKILGNFGDGGTLVTQDAQIAEVARRMFIYWENSLSAQQIGAIRIPGGFHHTEEGVHNRMVELTAAILRTKLPKLNTWIAARRKIAATYNDLFRDLDVTVPSEAEGVFHVYRNYAVQVHGNRDAIRHRLAELLVETGMHYTPPLHLQPVYQPLGYCTGDLPVTETVSNRLFTLPIYPQMTDEQIEWVGQAVHQVLSIG